MHLSEENKEGFVEQLANNFADKAELTAALVKANNELAKQFKEKEKQAAQLEAVNKELAHQIEETAKRAAALEAANKELESFSYSVSHDLRAPLRAINGFSQVLAEDYAGRLDDEAKLYLEEIIHNARKMGELIDNLLEFSRLGKQHVSPTAINITPLVYTSIQEIKQLYPEREVKITVNKLPHVFGDRNMLKQVFINLISNAFKYTGNRELAEIEIGAATEKESIVYYVKDNGAGFDMKYYDKLFGVFQRLHSSNEFDGTGVGLAIVEKIIAKHGGRVWAEGKVNEGACFYISLPGHNQ